jgi:hypothetical protein
VNARVNFAERLVACAVRRGHYAHYLSRDAERLRSDMVHILPLKLTAGSDSYISNELATLVM